MHEHTRRDTEICYALRMIELSGKRVTVMGLGRFGGGAGVSRWLCQQGARVVITDMKTEEQLGDAVGDVADLVADGSATLRLGRHDRSDFTATDLVIANPAVPMPWSNEFLLAAAEAGVAINTEVGLLVERLPSRERVIGITGTVGKSTTTAMTVHAIRALGLPAVVGGNLGGSLLGELAAITPETRVVLELSSAMLYWIERVQKWSPHVAVVTNFSENHGDWHGHIEHYRRSKQALLANQGPGDIAVLGPGVGAWADQVRAITGRGPGRVVGMESPRFDGPLAVPGRHNRVNAAMAIAVVSALEPDARAGDIARAMATFPGLPHRLALAHEHAGRRFYNDSKCTTPDALMMALAALSEESPGDFSKIHLIVGGYDKHADLSSVAALATRVAGLYCIGMTGQSIAQAARALAGPGAHGAIFEGPGLAAVVPLAIGRMRSGDSLLLSPACASWDQYPNYEHRGEHFCALVREHAGALSASER